MKFLNYTPHSVDMMDSECNIIRTFPSLGNARCSELITDPVMVDGIPIIEKRLGAVTGLPEPRDGVYHIVSMAVAQASPDRTDLLIVGQAVRNSGGNIIGTTSLARLIPHSKKGVSA